MIKPSALVVDDNKITTKLLGRYLSPAGYAVREAYDGIECLERVAEEQPDAIVMDVMMPRLDGYEPVKRLKSDPATAHIPVVIVTALNDVANQVKAIESGADDFLSKPIEDKLLLAKVKLLSTVSIERKKANTLKDLLLQATRGQISEAQAKEKIAELGLQA